MLTFRSKSRWRKPHKRGKMVSLKLTINLKWIVNTDQSHPKLATHSPTYHHESFKSLLGFWNLLVVFILLPSLEFYRENSHHLLGISSSSPYKEPKSLASTISAFSSFLLHERIVPLLKVAGLKSISSFEPTLSFPCLYFSLSPVDLSCSFLKSSHFPLKISFFSNQTTSFFSSINFTKYYLYYHLFNKFIHPANIYLVAIIFEIWDYQDSIKNSKWLLGIKHILMFSIQTIIFQ